jgi:hypothetical protein
MEIQIHGVRPPVEKMTSWSGPQQQKYESTVEAVQKVLDQIVGIDQDLITQLRLGQTFKGQLINLSYNVKRITACLTTLCDGLDAELNSLKLGDSYFSFKGALIEYQKTYWLVQGAFSKLQQCRPIVSEFNKQIRAENLNEYFSEEELEYLSLVIKEIPSVAEAKKKESRFQENIKNTSQYIQKLGLDWSEAHKINKSVYRKYNHFATCSAEKKRPSTPSKLLDDDYLNSALSFDSNGSLIPIQKISKTLRDDDKKPNKDCSPKGDL